ncbi:signal recognition particle protein, partial [Candidatus Woesearchaeota archaeon]|nr:signal recognition particle protein [Candidatus Woesearchaeota archaeon]
IAKGSGTDITDVRALLKQYKMFKKAAKMLKGGAKNKKMKQLMKQFGGQLPPGMGM